MDRNHRWLAPVLLAILLCAAASAGLQFFILKELVMNDTTEGTIDGDMVVPIERLPGETDQEYVDRFEAAVIAGGGQSVGSSD